MRLSEILRLVLINIRQNKSKVFLTSLGIIVGAATIVMVIAIGQGGIQDVEEQYSTLNAGTITVDTSTGIIDDMSGMDSMMGGDSFMSGMMDSAFGGITDFFSGSSSAGSSSAGQSSAGQSSAGQSSAGASSAVGGMTGGMDSGMTGGTTAASSGGLSAFADESLDIEILEFIVEVVPNIESGAISASTEATVYGGSLEDYETYTIVGTTSEYQDISNLSLLMGSFITDTDNDNETRCVVIGYDIASEMFTSISEAYDAKIEIDGRTYVINGVLDQVGTVVSGINPDSCIFIPYTTADKYLFTVDTSSQLSFLVDTISEVETVMANIELILAEEYTNTTFNIEDAGATMDAAMESANTLSMLLLAVAVIVFIVGGIGIMNVLFVSVKERTREIGILKAIGTKKGNILLCFLIEASVIGIIGGIFGIGLSFLLMPVLEYLEITAVMTANSLVLAFVFAAATATIFGFYPAFQASNLVPIEALNNE